MLFELHHPPGPGPVALGPMTGTAELAVTGATPRDAIALIDAMLVDLPGMALGPGAAVQMSVSDRDRLMATLYKATFGETVEGNTVCAACSARFDFDFGLDALLAAFAPDASTPDGEGWYDEGAHRFRVPTGLDEMAAAGHDTSAAAGLIAARCAPGAHGPEARAQVEERMAKVAPLIDLTLDAACPECGHVNPMAFRAERYMLTAVLNHRSAVLRDVHLLAANYQWSFAEITGLPRETRQALVAQVLRSRDAPRKAVLR